MAGGEHGSLGSVRHLTSVDGLSDAELHHLVQRSAWYAGPGAAGVRPLEGCVVGSFFRTTSTRTRSAFATAALRLGAGHVAYGPHDLQLNTGESMEDTARVLGSMLDALVVRTAADPAELRALLAQNRMAVINAMTADEHPTQAIADLSTIELHFGKIAGLRVLYIGEGNNTASALALALSRYANVEFCLATPPGYGLDSSFLERARTQAAQRGAQVDEVHDVTEAMEDADVVYTTRWQTTGTSKADPDWRTSFLPFQVNDALMHRNPRAVFMHDLPAHRGEEVTPEILDGVSSIAFRQAEQKMHSAKAVLEWCVRGRPA
ncbi:ornithine carbamoyltransferase [Micromonospora sp. HK10]|uniref:ornithine carbamoyltransferase n=1 Tax=Micromonospora sp. HK10 TaxID=1538294 RepID=UPI00062702BF|nr:ornithine carbamoyltransferase [Micromonospora sp. HK10]KKK06541.1 ornithine carbamoyltransferase [Micromonospora sp. HK10]